MTLRTRGRRISSVIQRRDNRIVRTAGTARRRGTRLSPMLEMLSSTLHQFVDPVRDSLGRIAQLLHRPVRRVTLGDVIGTGVIHQSLG